MLLSLQYLPQQTRGQRGRASYLRLLFVHCALPFSGKFEILSSMYKIFLSFLANNCRSSSFDFTSTMLWRRADYAHDNGHSVETVSVPQIACAANTKQRDKYGWTNVPPYSIRYTRVESSMSLDGAGDAHAGAYSCVEDLS